MTMLLRPPFLASANSGLTFRPDANCVLWLPGQDDAYSATIRDRSGNKNNGTISGATWLKNSKGLSYLSFDGAGAADDYVKVTDAASIQNIWDAGGTFDCWINPASDGEGDAGRIAEKTSWNLVVLGEVGGKVKVSFNTYFSTTTGRWTTTSTEVPINTQNKVTLTYNSSSVVNDPIISINGVPVALTEALTPVGTRTNDAGSHLYFGNDAGTTRTFDGGMALWKAHKVIKTAAQIQSEFNQERHLFGV